MANHSEDSTSLEDQPAGSPTSGWVKVGIIAAASAVAGGIAAAWWYRKTLIRLRQAEESALNPHFGMQNGDRPDDL